MDSFLQRSRHGTVYYFRRKVPVDLRGVVRSSVIYKSLLTSERRDAVVLARALAVKTDRIFGELRRMAKKKGDKPWSWNPSTVVNLDELSPRRQKIELSTTVTYGLSVDHDEVTKKKRVSAFDIKPGEEAAAGKAVLALQDAVFGRASPSAEIAPTPPIQECVDLYFAEDKATKPRTKQRYEQFLNVFTTHFGADKPLGLITQGEFNKYADHINATNRGWSTKKNYIGTAARFLKWSMIRGRTPHTISAATLKPQRTTPARHDRGAFTQDELRAIFENAVRFRHSKKRGKFWITVASAFLGGRVEELAQMDFDRDLKQTPDGTWYLRVQENPNEKDWTLKQSAKTMASWRDLPLHSALVRNGFIQFLHEEQRLGAKRPFDRYWKPMLRKKFGVVVNSHKISRWGGRELKKLRKAGKVTTPRVSYFHSHRHTLATMLATQGVSEEVRAAIAGQEYGGINSGVYSKLKDSPETLAPLVEKHLASYAELLDEVMAGASY